MATAAAIELKESFAMKTTYKAAVFPDSSCPELQPALVRLFKECQEVARVLLTCLSVALGQERDFLSSLHTGALGQCGTVANLTTLRVNHYPAVPDYLYREGVVRCGQHTDFGTITLLFQVRWKVVYYAQKAQPDMAFQSRT